MGDEDAGFYNDGGTGPRAVSGWSKWKIPVKNDPCVVSWDSSGRVWRTQLACFLRARSMQYD